MVEDKDIIYLEKKIGSKHIGNGSYAVLFKYEVDKVLKVFVKDTQNSIRREINIHSKLKHPNIVSFYGVGNIDKKFPCILLEYVDISIFEIQRWYKVINDQFTEEIIKAIAVQSFEALNYLHIKKIIHRDIKPSNLMLSKNGELKLIDFGTSRKLRKEPIKLYGACYQYQAPEQFFKKETYFKSEVWNLGVILYQLVANTSFDSPLFDYDNFEKEAISKKIIIPSCSQDLKKLINSCLKRTLLFRTTSAKSKKIGEKIMNIEKSKAVLRGFVNDLLSSKAFQSYIEQTRSASIGDIIHLKPFIKQFEQEKQIQAIAM